MNKKARFFQEELGQGVLEYALVVFLVAVVIIITISAVGEKTNSFYNNVVNFLAISH